MRRIGPPVDQLADDILLAGYARGDGDMALAFVRRFQSRVFGVAMAVLGDAASAEDVAQQAFERAWRHGGTFDPRRGSVGTWVAGITRNCAIDVARARRPGVVDADELLRRIVAPGPTPERAALGAVEGDELRAALRTLPPEQARAVVMAGIAGLTAAEVGEAEGIPLGTAKTRIRTAMQRLRAAMDHPEPKGA